MKKQIWSFLFFGVLLSIIGVFLSSCGNVNHPPVSYKQVQIGALLSTTTGGWTSLGKNSHAALEIAVSEANVFLASIEADFRFQLLEGDTKLDPQTALLQFLSMTQDGVKIVIGPQSSSELAKIKSVSDANDILVISQGSTASTLSTAGDNILRFCSDDRAEGQAAAALMWDDGIKKVISLYRADDGNMGLYTSTKSSFEALGGTVVGSVSYETTSPDYDAALASLKTLLVQALTTNPTAEVAVYYSAFDENIEIFTRATADPIFSSVKWYGSDGASQSSVILADSTAADFAISVGYPCPIFGFDSNAAYIADPLIAKIKASTGIDPDAFSLAAYDAFWVAALSYSKVGASASFDALKNAYIKNANSHFGATGWTILNDAGDRKFGNFDYWNVTSEAGSYKWERTASYNSATGVLTRY